MAIRFQCPSCAKTYSTDDNFAGRKMKCKECGHAFQVPAAAAQPAATSAPAGTIPFRCDGCGKTFHAPASFAGKTGKCKGCGQPIKIPATAAPVGATAASKPAAKPKPKPAPVEPPPADIYGLDENFAPTAGKSANPALELDGGSAAAEEKLPSRTAAFEPMTAAKKKKIAKRAAKIEKTKMSFAGAGMGVSLTFVIGFTLFGFRMYRTFHRAARLANAAAAVASADEDPEKVTATIVREVDKAIEEQVKDPTTAEAREWLDATKYPNHGVMEMDANTARAMVNGFYERGAEKVYVLEPTTLGNAVVTASFAIQLPADPAKRKQCIEWEAKHSEGEEPTEDHGQKYLIITTD